MHTFLSEWCYFPSVKLLSFALCRLSGYLELLKQQQEAVEEEIRRITSTLKNRLHDLGQASALSVSKSNDKSDSTLVGAMYLCCRHNPIVLL